MEQRFYQTLVRLGLMKFSEDQQFTNRNKPGHRSFIVDSRGAGSNPELMAMLLSACERAIESLPSFDMLGGVAHSGTPWAATLGYKMQLPFCNILKDPRPSGMQRQIEGVVQGKRVILIDNWLNTGDSIRHASNVLQTHGAVPVGVLAIASELNPDIQGLPIAYALNVATLVEAAKDLNVIPVTIRHLF